MRIDDRLDTALRGTEAALDGRVIGQWRQLIDILAQHPQSQKPERIAAGLVAVHNLGKKLDVEERRSGVAALNGRLRSPALLQLLAGDVPPVASEAIRAAQLGDEEWADLVPTLPVRARGFLRGRSDIGPKTQRALSSWAGADFRLSADPATTAQLAKAIPAADMEEPTQIGALVKRIEEWKRNREHFDSPRLPLGDEDHAEFPTPITEIQFETDDAGTIIWVEGAPRGAIVGTDIARPAYDNGPGPDAYGAAAFGQRMPMENARMNLRGSPDIDGDWRVSSAPFFDAMTGRFRGFRGIMRRPTLVEQPEQHAAAQNARIRQGENMQQIVHELRTPLGAISGFAEIIEQQLFGPVGEDYRMLANAILSDARRLLAGFDDISTAARLDAGNFEIDPGQTDCAWLTRTIEERLAPISDSIGVNINLSVADPVRPFAVEREFAERIFARLLSAIIVAGRNGEELNGRLKTELGSRIFNCLSLDLPEKLAALTEDELMGAGPIGDNQDDQNDLSPLLGLGFSLRLVRNLSRKAGGDLRFQNEQVLLLLPAVRDGDRNLRGNGGD